MTEILSGIYGTFGDQHEKVAFENGETIDTLSDLALAFISEQMDEGTELEKVAHIHGQVLQELEFFDLAGRAAAQAEFTEMEKAAAEGDSTALEAFFQDVQMEQEELSDAEQLKQAVMQELFRRQQG